MDTNTNVWLRATLIESVQIASNVKKLVFAVPGWLGHSAGQHVDIRLTASNGYSAERSYSIANAPGNSDRVELGVELLPDGEVSPYLWQLKPSAVIELRGPIGGHFVWNDSYEGSLVLIAGGSGMVPLMSMVRLAIASTKAHERDVILIISIRTIDRLLYSDELKDIQSKFPKIRVIITLTEKAPEGWGGYTRRVDGPLFDAEIGALIKTPVHMYVCGPTKFVEVSTGILVSMGFPAQVIKTERFGG